MCGKHNPLRDEAMRLFPSGVRVARDDALYFAPSPGEVPQTSALFRLDMRADGVRLFPTERAVRTFEAWAATASEGLGAELARLRHQPGSEPELALFAQGLKMLELHAAQGAWRAYDKKLRQQAAECLREKTGGGALFACSMLPTLAKKEMEWK